MNVGQRVHLKVYDNQHPAEIVRVEEQEGAVLVTVRMEKK